LNSESSIPTKPQEFGQTSVVQIPAKADYAIRALVSLAVADDSRSAEALAQEQQLPPKFLGAILSDLRRAGLVVSHRGAGGGFHLAKPADEITLATVLRVLGGPMAGVRGQRPEEVRYEGAAAPLQRVWVAVRQSLRDVLEHVTIADIASGTLPDAVTARTSDQDAWKTHTPS
jgi:Rrf2 family protein